jgi:hypothetical protein
MSSLTEPILIGIYGRSQVGKDTVADYLTKSLYLRKYAFAEPLKQMLKSAFGDNFHHGDRMGICPETGATFRDMMKRLGTEWGREFPLNPWLGLAGQRWNEVKAGEDFVVNPRGNMYRSQGLIISDVRFDSEADWIKKRGGVVIEVTKPSYNAAAGADGHPSEAGINHAYIDITVANDRDLHHLYSVLDALMRDYLTRK